MKTFWNRLPKPFFVMAPMKDVTDVAFRKIIARRGKPDVFFTEFVSADGLCHSAPPALLRDLQFSAEEHPIVAQIFSSKPEMISSATKLIAELGFDGVDINMGCPDRTVEKQMAGAALMKNSKLAGEIIRAAKDASNLPVSVKTRIGYSKESLDEWLPILLEADPAAITIHLRTRKELSLVPAHWELMKKAVDIRNRINPEVLLIGNGDVRDLEDAKIKAEESWCDGVMLGRAMFGNPWLFEGLQRFNLENSDLRLNLGNPREHGLGEKLDSLIELAYEFEKITPSKHFSILKKHIKAFVTGFAGAAELRAKLMEANSAAELESAIRVYQKDTMTV